MSKPPFEFLKAKPKFNINFLKPRINNNAFPSPLLNAANNYAASPSKSDYNGNSHAEPTASQSNPFYVQQSNIDGNSLQATPLMTPRSSKKKMTDTDPDSIQEAIRQLSSNFMAYKSNSEKQIYSLQNQLVDMRSLEHEGLMREQKIEDLENQIDFLNEQMSKQRHTFMELQKKLEQSNLLARNCEKVIESVDSTLKQYDNYKQELLEKIANCENDHFVLSKENKNLNSSLQALKKEKEILSTQAQKQMDENVTLRATNIETEELNDSLRKELDSKKEDFEIYCKSVEFEKSNLQSLVQIIKDFFGIVEVDEISLVEKLQHLNEILKKLEDENCALKSKSNDMHKLEEDKNIINAENKNLKDKCRKFEEELQRMIQDLASKNKELCSIEKDFEQSLLQSRMKSESLENERTELLKRLESKGKTESAESFAQMLKAQKLQMENNVKCLQMKLTNALSENESLKKEIEALKTAKSTLSSEADLSNLIQSLEKDVHDNELVITKDDLSDFMSPSQGRKKQKSFEPSGRSDSKLKTFNKYSLRKSKASKKANKAERSRDALDSDVWNVFDE